MRSLIVRYVLPFLLISCAVAAQAKAETCTQGAAGTAPSATLTFTAPTTNSDGTPITLPLTYTVLMGTTSGGETVLATGDSGSPIVITASLKGGGSYYFELEAVDSNGSSIASNEVCKTFPASVPNTVVITIT